jgi:hypothetical protein
MRPGKLFLVLAFRRCFCLPAASGRCRQYRLQARLVADRPRDQRGPEPGLGGMDRYKLREMLRKDGTDVRVGCPPRLMKEASG